ncbi:MAG: ornithine carbamoyltransferase [Lacipirellulaceae bacterium]
MRHLLTLADVTPAEIEAIFALTADLKAKFARGVREPLLPGRVMALVFEKQSLRTRVSFEACMTHLGGGSVMLGDDAGFGKRESVADFARVLSEMVDVVVLRSKLHTTVEEFARHAGCAVINGLTDVAHPCQALADLYTMRERFGSVAGRKLAWVGDGNNVARSLAEGCAKAGVEFVMASPPGYEMDSAFLDEVRADSPGAILSVTHDPVAAVTGASAVYTDVWASMGQEAEEAQRRRDFADFQVNEALMAHTPHDALFMHCLPAKRGEEVTDGVIDGPKSVVVQQAGNRMHAQKGVLVWLLGAHAAG